MAKQRLLNASDEISNGLFLVRESSTFVGEFTLSFVYSGVVHHVSYYMNYYVNVINAYILLFDSQKGQFLTPSTQQRNKKIFAQF